MDPVEQAKRLKNQANLKALAVGCEAEADAKADTKAVEGELSSALVETPGADGSGQHAILALGTAPSPADLLAMAIVFKCVACLNDFKNEEFVGKKPTRYANHCQKCSLDLRNILKSCEGSTGASHDPEDTPEVVPNGEGNGGDNSGSTRNFLRKLSVENPDEYRKVFQKFKETTLGVSGRGVKKPSFNAKALCVSETTQAEKRQVLGSGWQAMDIGTYVAFFTSNDRPQEDRLDEAQARLSWTRELNDKTTNKDSIVANVGGVHFFCTQRHN